ncbi:ParB/RepB/Spo0J family partition protein [Intestinimonas massiliensis (ex Afouda et al. 2020)]|uniref:ParB/RepB/Spo0J family partition protein n=1 Tax=Intestinimonas massiliensis (ex Afouda et al. 2020) TaxID=1673721 RepID=UPI0034A05F52
MEEPKSKAKRGAKTAAAAQEDKITLLPLSELHDFPNHPFKVRDDEAMQETVESIRQYGVLVPAIVRPREDGGYEIVAGHRRKHGSELAGLQNLPCIVREMDDDTATILMVDSNIQRENILPSERAQAYKMKLEAIRRKAGRPAKTEEKADENNSPQVAANFRADDTVAKDAGISGDTVRRYIRLTELSPELQQMVDEKKIGMTPAVEISYALKMPVHRRNHPRQGRYLRHGYAHLKFHDGVVYHDAVFAARYAQAQQPDPLRLLGLRLWGNHHRHRACPGGYGLPGADAVCQVL